MTNYELSQLRCINREIQSDKTRLKELEDAATNISSKITGLPHINTLSDKTAIAAEITDYKQMIEAKIHKSLLEYAKLTEYINSVPDSQIRQILKLRYIDGLSWSTVAIKFGGNNCKDNVRMLATRYIEKNFN